MIDALARLRMAARRKCWTVHIEGLTPDVRPLRDVLALVGLDELFALEEEPTYGPQRLDDLPGVSMNQDGSQ
jgi:hypothetical protein